MIAITPDFRAGWVNVFLLLVTRYSGQLEHPVRVQDRVALRAVSSGACTRRRTALAAGGTGPTGRRGHGRRAATGRRARRDGLAASGQVPGPDVRLDRRERLLPGQAPGTSGRLVPEHWGRDAVYDIAQPTCLGRVRDGGYAGFRYQVLGAHRTVIHVTAAAAPIRRPLQPTAPGRAH